MKLILTYFFCLAFICDFFSQLNYKSSVVVSFNQYTFEESHEYDPLYNTENLYNIYNFPTKYNFKIFFDVEKTKTATLITYDSINKKINIKHFNTEGKLIKEIQANYQTKKKYDPERIKEKDLEYAKTYFNDSIICKITGFKTSILINYKNPETKTHFEKRIFFDENDRTGENIWEFHPNGNLKSVCSSYYRHEFHEGAEVVSIVYDCRKFDINGCLLPND